VLLKPKLRKSKNQASVGRQELKIQQAEQMAKKAYQMSSRCALIYTPSALQDGGPRLSLTVAILAKGRCFFGPSALGPLSISQSEFIILTN
jgi:hypothetical protein